MEVCKVVVRTSLLTFQDTERLLASGDLDSARASLAGIKAGVEIAQELGCPSHLVRNIKNMHKEAHRLYSDMLSSRVEALIHRTKVV